MYCAKSLDVIEKTDLDIDLKAMCDIDEKTFLLVTEEVGIDDTMELSKT